MGLLDRLLARLGIPPAGPEWDAYLDDMLAEATADEALCDEDHT